MQQRTLRAGMLAVTAAALLLMAQTSALAASARVSGGGVVGGPLGVTSQLGFQATSEGGHFLCIMAGRSGGFPFGPWASVSQMQVQGGVTPGSLTISGSSSSFTGFARVHVVGKTPSGDVLKASFDHVAYVSRQGAGGAGTAWHWLQIPAFGIDTGASTLIAGHITIAP